MNILFLTLASVQNGGIYLDLLTEMKKKGHNIYVITPLERRDKIDTHLCEQEGLNILKVKTGNIKKVNMIEKGISTIMVEKQFINAINRNFKDIKFDIITYSTPPITFSKVVRHVKKRDNAKSYLMLKDIFPQNAVDLNLIKKGGLIYKFFRKKEIDLYRQADYIGCMSQGNIDFILRNNDINLEKLEILPNAKRLTNIETLDSNTKTKIRRKYNIPTDKTIFIYGGSIGKPQGIDFLMKCIKSNEKRKDSVFLIVGAGTEYNRLERFINENNFKNTLIYPYIIKKDYDTLVRACDVGMVFLDYRFTIPNIPSRILSYMEYKLPIIAATDINTDLKDIITSGNFGLWSESNDLDTFNNNVDNICKNVELRERMATNGYIYLEENYTVDKAYNIIMNHFE